MKFFNKMERKFGRYAIKNLTWVLIGGFVIGYLLSFVAPNVLSMLTLEPYFIIHNFQIWRLVTWLIIPPGQASIFTIIMLLFYFSIGNTLEQMWGAFRFNAFIFLGIILSILASFVLYFISGGMPFNVLGSNITGSFSTYYICLSMFLAYGLTFPEARVLIYFIIPVKMKWLSIIYLLSVAYSFYQGGWVDRTAIICSLVGVVIYYFVTRNIGNRINPKEIKRKQEFKRAMSMGEARGSGVSGHAVHKCAICGRTEKDDPNLEFRYCSKCKGNYEYCQDHLFTHEHKK